jgi:type IV pilus assembly protein PilM
MISILPTRRVSPIGVDLGSRSVKLVQLSADRSAVIDSSRWDLPGEAEREPNSEPPAEHTIDALHQAREGRSFCGRDVVLCLNHRQLFLQSVRVPKMQPADTQRAVQQEAASRVPFPLQEAEVRFVEAADIRHGDGVVREIILMACHRPVLEGLLNVVERAGLRPVAVDVEPAALTRSFAAQFRREQDRDERCMLVHVGNTATGVVTVQQQRVLFVKYIPLGGRHLDESVARNLKMTLAEAISLRRHNGDRRKDHRDPEIARSIAEAIRPVVARLAAEIAMCARYHSVTFRGQALSRIILGGGEATRQLLQTLQQKLGVTCELSDPFRALSASPPRGRAGQWDVAAGLALRNLKGQPSEHE